MDFPKYPRISRDDFESWNEDMFIRYNNERVYHHPNPLIRFIERRRVNTLIDLLQPLTTRHKVLAAGCGEGYIEKRFSCGHLTLVDISTEAIARAKREKYPTKKVKFVRANLEKLPLKSASFDRIECSEVIEHVYSPTDMLTELRRVVKPRGHLVISFPNEPLINSIKSLLIKLRLFHLFFPNVPEDMTEEWHLHAFSLTLFQQHASQSHWKIVVSKPIPFFFLPIRWVVKCVPV